MAFNSGGYSLANNQVNTTDPVNYKYDATTFRDADACPVSSRINVYLYADLAALLVAPGATYNGGVQIDFTASD